MEPTYKTDNSARSRRPIVIAAAAVLVFVALIILTVVMFANNDTKKITNVADQTPETSSVATKSMIDKNLSTTKDSLQQASLDQAAAKAVIANNNNTQVKVGQ
jgi:predicted PurR-regulated permease PerM